MGDDFLLTSPLCGDERISLCSFKSEDDDGFFLKINAYSFFSVSSRLENLNILLIDEDFLVSCSFTDLSQRSESYLSLFISSSFESLSTSSTFLEF